MRIRDLMRYAPHPLTIIIARATPDSPPCALLVSSFNTVTISPTPFVSFNIKVPSSTYDAIRSSGHFTASIVDSAKTANAFVTQEAWRNLLTNGEMLSEGKGGVVWMRCEVVEEKCQDIGDHMLVVAKVTDGEEYVKSGDEGLVYWRGKYRTIGATVEV